MIIESVDNKKIKEYRKLKEKKYRDSEKLFLVEGEHLVLEAYKEAVKEKYRFFSFGDAMFIH